MNNSGIICPMISLFVDSQYQLHPGHKKSIEYLLLCNALTILHVFCCGRCWERVNFVNRSLWVNLNNGLPRRVSVSVFLCGRIPIRHRHYWDIYNTNMIITAPHGPYTYVTHVLINKKHLSTLRVTWFSICRTPDPYHYPFTYLNSNDLYNMNFYSCNIPILDIIPHIIRERNITKNIILISLFTRYVDSNINTNRIYVPHVDTLAIQSWLFISHFLIVITILQICASYIISLYCCSHLKWLISSWRGFGSEPVSCICGAGPKH